MTPHSDIDLGQHCFRKWLAAWWHQATTWTYVDLSSVRSGDINLRAISKEKPQQSITKIILKITYLKFHSNFPGANELIRLYCNGCNRAQLFFIVFQPDFVVHAAAERRPDVVEGQKEATEGLNVTATETLCKAAGKDRHLIILVPSYLGLTKSISWLLMPWLLASPGHQQQWYWLCKLSRSLSYMRKDFNYLCHISVEEW